MTRPIAALLLLSAILPFAWIVWYLERALRKGDGPWREYGRVDFA